MTRADLAAMLSAQTTACQPARAALLADGTFAVWDGLVPAEQLARTYRARLRRTQRRGQPTLGLDATVDLLFQAAQEPLRVGQIRPADKSWTFMIFLNADATEILACTGVARSDPPPAPDSDTR
ncbi:hypothetical protein OG204_00460 [Streptomyces sp. NBC_01387]|uniref:hypothetical protein n=1 Tax=Streptomyces sp. NBC_01387 TaxID=2903849 RepID=UPI003254DB8D